jgi:hypothetical protein
MIPLVVVVLTLYVVVVVFSSSSLLFRCTPFRNPLHPNHRQWLFFLLTTSPKGSVGIRFFQKNRIFFLSHEVVLIEKNFTSQLGCGLEGVWDAYE